MAPPCFWRQGLLKQLRPKHLLQQSAGLGVDHARPTQAHAGAVRSREPRRAMAHMSIRPVLKMGDMGTGTSQADHTCAQRRNDPQPAAMRTGAVPVLEPRPMLHRLARERRRQAYEARRVAHHDAHDKLLGRRQLNVQRLHVQLGLREEQ